MNTIPPGPRLPLDVCAEVIKALVPPFDPLSEQTRWGILDRASHHTLLACCLVCSDWLGCARRVLYRHVLFTHPKDVDNFLTTITLHPFLAYFVRALSVDAGWGSRHGGENRQHTYIPFARTDLVRKLPRLEVLTYHTYMTALSQLYPPNYSFLLTQFPITTLTLCRACDTPYELCRLIWGLANLRCLRLVDMFSAISPNWDDHSSWKNMKRLRELAARRPRCRSPALKVLDLVKCENLYMLLANFPFRSAFGDALTSVNIVADWWCVKGGARQAYMQEDSDSSEHYVATMPVTDGNLGIHKPSQHMDMFALRRRTEGVRRFVDYLLSLDELESLTVEVLAHPRWPQFTSGNLYGDSRGWQDSGTTAYLDVWWSVMHTAISEAQYDVSARLQPFGRLRRIRVGVGRVCNVQDAHTMAYSGRSNDAYRHKDSEAEHDLDALERLSQHDGLQRTIAMLPALQELEISADQVAPRTTHRLYQLGF
ncbi:hypothetical protein C8Q73DRAFT_274061 [Cubamyces lactineus]|nr:hypothetical protein C8Q73DRAFT_274061 [Cubamyces lactineus]